MPKLQWSQADKNYRQGISHGVLYPSTGPGVAWNGLMAVAEKTNGGEVSPSYYDGKKTRDDVGGRDFAASILSFDIPKEFDACLGYVAVRKGVYVTGQTHSTFGFSYQTLTGSSVYLIHLVYNALAVEKTVSRKTRADGIEITSRALDVEATPTIFKSAHVYFKSTDPRIETIKNILYGTSNTQPRMLALGDIS